MNDFRAEMIAGLQENIFGGDSGLAVQAKNAPDWTTLELLLSRRAGSMATEIADRELCALTVCGPENPYESILRCANGEELDWMEKYGLPIGEEERALADFLFAYPVERRKKIGEHIAEAFFHGFVSQSRDRRGRTRVRLRYCVGQEALAQQVLRALEVRGARAVVIRPECLARSGQHAMDHSADLAACLSETSLVELLAAYETAFRQHSAALLDTCGMIGIGQFGESAGIPHPAKGAYIPGEARYSRLFTLENAKRTLEARYLAPSDLSFCKVAFPNILAGENFKEIFDAFYKLNTMESEHFERIQQTMIDALDTCVRVELTGAADNHTRLTVALHPLADRAGETNFLNCGGDLNIPHGELFTTPVLSATCGVLHVKEIYLKGVYFKDLELHFDNGMISDYSCGGCTDHSSGRAYVKKHLMGGWDTLPIGEFAIGSNTLAYAIARDLHLFSRLPILLAEKMGPHIAVGDPCFARGEDAPVYNLYDNKEMTARENERTARRNTGEEVYTNLHTDITLPFDELARLTGIRADGSEVPILADGRFVLPGTGELNKPLEGNTYE